MTPPDLKVELHRTLTANRATLLAKLDGLSEYDMRRSMTPTGTNLLGLVKHLAGIEYSYLGESFDRPPPEALQSLTYGRVTPVKTSGPARRVDRRPRWWTSVLEVRST